MYGANVMDGKFKTFTVPDLLQSSVSDKKILKENFYVEVPYGV
jgi:hypothetical protein